jgi:glycosyltransferase involved in cell wall biosynthesis
MDIVPKVITLFGSPTDLAAEYQAAGIDVQSMNLPHSGRSRYLRLISFTHEVCREFRPDAFLSMPLGWHSFMGLGAKAAGVGVVAAHVGNYPDDRTASFRKFKLQVQSGRPITSKLICCSSYVQRGVVDCFGVSVSETEVVYNGVDVDAVARRSSAARAQRSRNGAFAVGMVARYEVHKDQPTLIRAAKLLRDAGRSIEVWLIGDGSRRAEYERLIADLRLAQSVKLLGVRRDVPELLAQLDAFVFSATPDEGLGVALIEAMAAGTPIVASDVGACQEVLDGGSLGALVRARDPGALADALDLLARDPGAAFARAEKARRKATEVFSIEAMATSYARTLGVLEPSS